MWLTRPSTGPEFQGGGQALKDGVPVLLQAGGEGVQAGQVFCADGGDPVFEVLAGAGGEDLGEGSDESARGIEFGAQGEASGQLLAVFVPESVGMAHHPSGDLADTDTWWCWADEADAQPTARPQVVADGLVVAPAAELLELSVQMDGVHAALGPASIQVWLVGIKLAGPRLTPSGQQLFGGFGAGGAADGVGAYMQFPGDLTDGVPLVHEGVDDGVPLADAGFDRRSVGRCGGFSGVLCPTMRSRPSAV
jgi:hypothetical protein